MKSSVAKTADKLVPAAPKNILDVLPEMIRIAKEGNEFDRISRMLEAAGWTEMDLWREVKKLYTGAEFTLTLQNRFRDITRHNMRDTRYADGLKQSLRWIKKRGGASEQG